MTDTEIIKALELLHKRILKDKFASRVSEGEMLALVEVKDIINRLKAENERLQKEADQFADIGKMYSEIRYEAVRECTKFLIDKSENGVISVSDLPDYVLE